MATFIKQGVSMVVPASGSARDTLIRVRSLLRQGPRERELIIIDNSLLPGDITQLRQFIATQPTIQLFHYDDAPSLGAMFNRAARKARRSCVLFVLDDIRIDSAATLIIEKMLRRALEPGTGPVGCMVVDKNKTILNAGIYKPSDQPFEVLYGGHSLGTVIRKLDSLTYPYDPRRSRPVVAVAGAVLVSRDVLRTVGGFQEDARLQPAAAQIELCLRANQAGYQTWFCGGGHLIGTAEQRSLQPAPDLLARLNPFQDTWSPDAPAARKASRPRFRLPWRR